MSDKIRLKLNEMKMKWDKTDKLRKRRRKIDYCQVYPAINLNYSNIQYEKISLTRFEHKLKYGP